MIEQIDKVGLKAAANQAGISMRRARVWQKRWVDTGMAGLCGRSSCPHVSPRTTAPDKRERIVNLRRNYRLPYPEIARRVRVSVATVGRVCAQAGAAKLPPIEAVPPKRHYERPTPGEILHLDTKKPARFERPGHRVTGDPSQISRTPGGHTLHVAIDDHLRVGFSLILPFDPAKSTITLALAALRYYQVLGVKVTRIMTDNGSAYRSKKFAKPLRRLGIRHLRTRPYTPQTNGKAERFIQTLLRGWTYAYADPNSDARTRELPFWIRHYNFRRPHSATGNRPPVSRLGLMVNNVMRNYT